MKSLARYLLWTIAFGRRVKRRRVRMRIPLDGPGLGARGGLCDNESPIAIGRYLG